MSRKAQSTHWEPPEGSDNPMRMLNDQWFNTKREIERACFERGKHRWGRDKFADEAGVQGYHKCLDCYRIEPL